MEFVRRFAEDHPIALVAISVVLAASVSAVVAFLPSEDVGGGDADRAGRGQVADRPSESADEGIGADDVIAYERERTAERLGFDEATERLVGETWIAYGGGSTLRFTDTQIVERDDEGREEARAYVVEYVEDRTQAPAASESPRTGEVLFVVRDEEGVFIVTMREVDGGLQIESSGLGCAAGYEAASVEEDAVEVVLGQALEESLGDRADDMRAAISDYCLASPSLCDAGAVVQLEEPPVPGMDVSTNPVFSVGGHDECLKVYDEGGEFVVASFVPVLSGTAE